MPVPSPVERRFFVPEVVQTSAMDCGPATLKCLLEGFGVPASYGRLREACQTDVDGTSIDTIEDVAVQLGLRAEQIMIPTDHLLLPEAQTLPAIVVTQRPDGSPHFVVAWSLLGGFVQVMDPGTGRRWPTRQRFLDETYVHFHPVPAKAWRAWAGTEGFCLPLQRRLLDLRLDEPEIEGLMASAQEDEGWTSLAALDAATRIVGSITRAGGVDRGKEAAKLVTHFYRHALQEPPGKSELVPGPFWSVGPVPGDASEEEMVLLRGAVLVRVLGRQDTAPFARPEVETDDGRRDAARELRAGDPAPLSPDLVAALEAKPSRPELEVFRALREDGLLTPAVLLAALFLASAGVIVEALLLRGIIDIGQDLALSGQRIELMALFFAFALILLLLELPISGTVLRYGRRLETRLRTAFLAKIPRLGDRYFRSRLTSDMTQRAHGLRQLRDLPDLGIRFLRLGFQLILTAMGIIWLEPASAPIAILAAVFGVGLAFATQPLLSESDLRLRTHLGALGRYYLDALLGLVPLRTHGAERSLRREHEGLLVEWARAGQAFFRLDMVIQGFGAVVSLFFSVLIMFRYIGQGGEASGVILLLYWSLSLPVLGQALAMTGQQYPIRRNSLLRLLEPLEAPEEEAVPKPVTLKDESLSDKDRAKEIPARGATLTLKRAAVQLGGHVVLEDLNLTIGAGEHVAIVGPSGAGKTTLVGLFLGWHRTARGELLVDGAPLEGAHLYALRRATAWVDPAVQLWNRTLLENLRYGETPEGETATVRIGQVVEQAGLFGILERLPGGLQTVLGEGGGLVSGGEGQRVRLGRALLRSGVRLAILDEPFRGLDRARRRQLLAEARKHWQDTTLICVTHDVGETQAFGRVVVIEDGRIVEDGAPDVLAGKPGSRYRSLLEAEKAVREGFWEGTTWRRLWLEDGRLSEKE